MGKAVKGIGKVAGKVGQIAAPFASFIPGGSMITQGLGMLGRMSGGGGQPQQQQQFMGGGSGMQLPFGMSGQQAGMMGLGAGGLALAMKNGMFKPGISSVGGGRATGMGNQFTDWQQGALNGTMGMSDAIQNMMNGRIGDPQSLQQYFGAGMGGNGQAQIGESNAEFGYKPMASEYQQPDWQGQEQYQQPDFQQAQMQALQTGNPTQQINSGQVNSNFGFGGVDVNYNPNQINAPQINTDVEGISYNAPSWADTQLRDVQMVGANDLPDVLQGVGSRANLQSIINPEANARAVQALMGRQRNMDVANLRQRFGNQAMGTGAQFAESQYLAEAMPREALAIDDIVRQNNQLGLQQRGQDLESFTSGRGMDINQYGMASSNVFNRQAGNNQGILGLNSQNLQQGLARNQFSQQNAMSQMQAEQANLNAMLQANQLNSGYDMQAQMANSQNQQFGANLGLQAGQMNLEAQMKAAQLGTGAEQFNVGQDFEAQRANAANELAAMGYSNDAIQSMNQQQLQQVLAENSFNQQGGQFGANQSLQEALAQNQFNQQNAQFGAQQDLQSQLYNNQFGFDAAKMNQGNQQFNINSMLQNQQMGNQWNMGLQNIGQQREGNQLQGQQNAIAQLMESLRQTQRIGTPQAETAISPSMMSQLFQGAGAAGDLWGAYNQAKALGQQGNPQQQQANAPWSLPSWARNLRSGNMLQAAVNRAPVMTPQFNPSAARPLFNMLPMPANPFMLPRKP